MIDLHYVELLNYNNNNNNKQISTTVIGLLKNNKFCVAVAATQPKDFLLQVLLPEKAW
jgi:hypothetical protein